MTGVATFAKMDAHNLRFRKVDLLQKCYTQKNEVTSSYTNCISAELHQEIENTTYGIIAGNSGHQN